MQTDNDMVMIAQNRDEAEYQKLKRNYFSENWSWTFSKELKYIIYIMLRVINCKDPHTKFFNSPYNQIQINSVSRFQDL